MRKTVKDTPENNEATLPSLGPLGMLRWAWTQLTSMRTALFLLLLLAVAAVPGSLFPQRPANPAVVTQYLKDHPGDVAGFAPWLAEKKEQILDLTTGGFTHFDDVLALDGAVVRLVRKPEELVFVSAKTGSATYEPWLRV